MDQDHSSPNCEETRRRVIAFLLFFTSERCFAILEKFVAPDQVGYELSRLWFDEIYTPSLRYLDTLKGDYSSAKTRDFEACFEVEELLELERFHRFFELRLDMLTATHKSRQAFPQNDSWRNLVKHARKLVNLLEPQAGRRREVLEENLGEAVREQGQLPPLAVWQLPEKEN